MMMTRKEFWKWLALCPAPEGYSEDSGYFIAEDNGDEVRVFFYFDIEESDDD
tara:strand:- start:188 stop:343 length:156 start_codon:yes stop_codon:yes gene_type:complete